MTTFANDWAVTSNPADHTRFNEQPGHVRKLRTDMEERFLDAMYGFVSGETTDGTKRIKFRNQASDPPAVAAAILMHAKDDVDPTAESELFGTHETDGITQWTSKGGPRVVLNSLTNKDTATIAAFDCVVRNHASTAKSFKGTTTAGDLDVIGVNQKSAAADAKGAVTHVGRTPVNMESGDSGGKGDYITSSTTKGKCKTVGTTWQPGVFGVLQTDITSDVAIAEVFPVQIAPLSFTSEAQGDIAFRGASVWERLAAVAGGNLVSKGASNDPVFSTWAFSEVTGTAAQSESAGTMTDITSLTTGAITVIGGLVIVKAEIVVGGTTGANSTEVVITDGSNNVKARGLQDFNAGANPFRDTITLMFMDAPAAGSVTYKCRFKKNGTAPNGRVDGSIVPHTLRVAYQS